jgi:hypothetical protein
MLSNVDGLSFRPHLRYYGAAMEPRVKYSSKVRKRNIPVHIVFWLSVIALLYIFYKAFS